MTFEELGKALHSERKKRGLGIEDVAERLKISPRLIRAIEEGNLDAFPHQAYARGFIRSYAAFLGMVAEEVQDAANAVEVEDPVTQEAYPLVHAGGIFRWMLLLLALALLGGGGYYAYKKDFLKVASVHPPRLARPSPPKTPPSTTPDSAKAAPGDSRVSATDSSGAAAEKKQPAVESTPQAAAAKYGASQPAHEQKNDQVPGDKKNSGPHKVVIVATEECWIHSSADRTDTRQFSLRKGDTFALTFAHRLDLKLGNAGGVRIRYDGNEIEPAGQSGQVRTISFPPDNDR